MQRKKRYNFPHEVFSRISCFIDLTNYVSTMVGNFNDNKTVSSLITPFTDNVGCSIRLYDYLIHNNIPGFE